MKPPSKPQGPESNGFRNESFLSRNTTRRDWLISAAALAAMWALIRKGQQGPTSSQPAKTPEPQNIERLPEAERIANIKKACEEIQRLGIGTVEWVHPEGATDANPKNPFILVAQTHPGDGGEIRKDQLMPMWNGFRTFSLLQHIVDTVHIEGHPVTTNLAFGNLRTQSNGVPLTRTEIRQLLTTNFDAYTSALAAANRPDKVVAAVCDKSLLLTGTEDPTKLQRNDDALGRWLDAYDFLKPITSLMQQHGEPRIMRDTSQKAVLLWGDQVFYFHEIVDASRDIAQFEVFQKEREKYLATLPGVQLAYFGGVHADGMKKFVPGEAKRSLAVVYPRGTEKIFAASKAELDAITTIALHTHRWRAQAMNAPSIVPSQIPGRTFPSRLNPPLPRK